MSGDLHHAVEFDHEPPYLGHDNKQHVELTGSDYDSDGVSVRRWHMMVSYCFSLGIPSEAWPQHETSIDLNLDEVHRKNVEIRSYLSRLTPEQIRQNDLLERKIIPLVQKGMLFVFSELD